MRFSFPSGLFLSSVKLIGGRAREHGSQATRSNWRPRRCKVTQLPWHILESHSRHLNGGAPLFSTRAWQGCPLGVFNSDHSGLWDDTPSGYPQRMRYTRSKAKKLARPIPLICVALLLAGSGVSASASSIVIPRTSLTPGATNAAVGQANIAETICKSGWTATIRPSSAYTDKIKKQQLFGSYSFYTDKDMGHYEEDHLISLELGGSPTSVLNLWPEPYAGATGARVKDKVETKLKTLICNGTVSLKTAQHAIATNWFAAYQEYVLDIVPTIEPTPTDSPTPIVIDTPTLIVIHTPTPTPTTSTSSSSTITPGAFCASAGATGQSSKGVIYTCKTSATDSRLRWRQ